MSSAELKIDLITKITDTNDDTALKDIQRILNFELDDEVFKLNEAQRAAISAAKTAYRSGDFITDKQANNDIQEWSEK